MIAGIIGAAGYAGSELVRLLAGHPGLDGFRLGSVSRSGERIEELYPNFRGTVSAVLEEPEEVIAAASVVFAALPHGVGEPYAKACLHRGIPFIDLSADFRFDNDEALYAAWYGVSYRYPELRNHSVYGLPEFLRPRIKELAASGKVIIGNPGCYPTAAALGAFPALAEHLAGEGPVIVDAASGVTGAGREPGRAYHFPECADSVSPYKVGAHRHSPEMARTFALMRRGRSSGQSPGALQMEPLIFTPHLAPMNRGILATIYIPLAERRGGGSLPPSKEIEDRAGEIRERYAAFYRDEPFVRVLPAGITAASGRVRQSNFCDISVHLDGSGSTLIVISAIDNMVKGAAGQAIQNMNLVMGFEESSGLKTIPALF